MKSYKLIAALIMMLALLLCACAKEESDVDRRNHQSEDKDETENADNKANLPAVIYLCGERHSDETSFKRELEMWDELYTQGARHLFIEYPYATAEYLNIWMHEDNDEILDQLWIDLEGTLGNRKEEYEFLKTIKKDYPGTIFHGTDVGHQHATTGARYIEMLEKAGKKDSEEYKIAFANNRQGDNYYRLREQDLAEGNSYREQCLAKNFIRELEKLPGEIIMGIYGNAHVEYDVQWNEASMAKQLTDQYGDDIVRRVTVCSEEPIRIDKMTVAGKEYDASYFGELDITGYEDYISVEFWRLENAYDDFASCKLTGQTMFYNSYLMRIEEHQVFVVIYHKNDGSSDTAYYRSDGEKYEGMPATSEFIIGK